MDIETKEMICLWKQEAAFPVRVHVTSLYEWEWANEMTGSRGIHESDRHTGNVFVCFVTMKTDTENAENMHSQIGMFR